MNQQTAYAEWTVDGYVGKFQLAWRTEVYEVKQDGKTQHFKYKHDAEIAAWRAKDAIENTTMYREGVTLSDGKYPEAEALFKKVKAA
ncbi:hypothetical protein RI570_11440 [Brucella pseudogrignonensis]|uniref:hypothetical protein n=1 Tax=Brucella pseudogrignonensis TaxID=419475 RepID=UPI0028B90A3E|nr:hypothetical protein [Brucella pseudogrignonensis]MDT6940761.1 hypothetical protein [Brucella pseudogrignonensis]